MKIEKGIETLLFQSRWLLAPLYIGLVGTLFILMIKFAKKFIELASITWTIESTELILRVLGLIDVVLIANLLLIIIFSGYENFVSKIDLVEGHVDRPDWMGKVDYSALKLKVIGSIVAISSIELLKVFIDVATIHEKPEAPHFAYESVMWLVVIHLTFVISGVLFALMERIQHGSHYAEAHSPCDEESKEEKYKKGEVQPAHH